jgi:hypothetical protein
MVKIKIDLDIGIPAIPTILNVNGREDIHIPIDEISNEYLQKIGEEWTKKLISMAEKLREVNNKDSNGIL